MLEAVAQLQLFFPLSNSGEITIYSKSIANWTTGYQQSKSKTISSHVSL